MFFLEALVLACFHPQWPKLKMPLACFDLAGSDAG
jgi:hypothetical protein